MERIHILPSSDVLWHLDSIKIWKMKHHFFALGQFLHVDLWTWVYETQKKEGCLTCSRVSMAEWTQKSIFWKRRKKLLYDLLPISDLTFLYSAVIRATGLTTVVVSKLVEAVPSSRPVAGAVPSSRAGAGAAANSRAVAEGGSLRRLLMSWIKTWKATTRRPWKPIDGNDGASFHVSAGRLWCSRLRRIIFWEHITSVSFGLRKLFPLPIVISNEKPP